MIKLPPIHDPGVIIRMVTIPARLIKQIIVAIAPPFSRPTATLFAFASRLAAIMSVNPPSASRMQEDHRRKQRTRRGDDAGPEDLRPGRLLAALATGTVTARAILDLAHRPPQLGA